MCSTHAWCHSDGAWLACYKDILPSRAADVGNQHVAAELQQLSLSTAPWAFFMCAGGHFAAAVIAQGKGADVSSQTISSIASYLTMQCFNTRPSIVMLSVLNGVQCNLHVTPSLPPQRPSRRGPRSVDTTRHSYKWTSRTSWWLGGLCLTRAR
jgi:hypothetical protein